MDVRSDVSFSLPILNDVALSYVMRARARNRPLHRGVHKLHFDNNAELTLSRLRIYHCAPLIESIDPSAESGITSASSQSMSLSRVLCTPTLNSTMLVCQPAILLSTSVNDNTWGQPRYRARRRVMHSSCSKMRKLIVVFSGVRERVQSAGLRFAERTRIVYRDFHGLEVMSQKRASNKTRERARAYLPHKRRG